jgi:hypothetical protein
VSRAGLNTAEVVAWGPEPADQTGIGSVSLAALVEPPGGKAPVRYQHIEGIGDLQHRNATMAMTEFGDIRRDAFRGGSRADVLKALVTTLPSYLADHPGRS